MPQLRSPPPAAASTPAAAPSAAAAAEARSDLPPLVVLMNARSGAQQADTTQATIAARLQAAGRRVRIVAVAHPAALAARARAEAQAAQRDGAVLVAAGGDGTLNAVARAALELDVPFGALPQGTFNYFARSNGIALEPDDALTQLLSARITPMQVGRVRDARGTAHPFLVNGSVGLYPRLLEEREAVKQRFGRKRFIALLAGLRTLLRGAPRWRLVVRADAGPARALRLTTLFIGNNRLQLEQLGVPQADAVEQGHLAAVLVHAPTSRSMLAAALRGAAGAVTSAAAVDSPSLDRIEVRPQDAAVRWVKVAVDGEVLQLQPPLVFDLVPRPLRLLAPVAPLPAR
jgi:diacylglycerol kinase family enzyme